jgi:hypothetical protein
VTDARIIADLEAIGHQPATPVTADELRAIYARVAEDVRAALQGVADAYRPHYDGKTDHQAVIARNAALTCLKAAMAVLE